MALVADCGFRRNLGTGKSLSFVRQHMTAATILALCASITVIEVTPSVSATIQPVASGLHPIKQRLATVNSEMSCLAANYAIQELSAANRKQIGHRLVELQTERRTLEQEIASAEGLSTNKLISY